MNQKFTGRKGSLGGWILLTSLNHERGARNGYAVSFQIKKKREVPGHVRQFTEEKGFIEMITQEAEDRNLLDKIMRQDLYVKVQSLAEGVCLPYLPLLF